MILYLIYFIKMINWFGLHSMSFISIYLIWELIKLLLLYLKILLLATAWFARYIQLNKSFLNDKLKAII